MYTLIEVLIVVSILQFIYLANSQILGKVVCYLMHIDKCLCVT